MLRVAVVGSGPSGVYAAQTLVQQREVPGVRVDVLDRLPAPYGLVRYGVAPDHEKIKSLQGNLRTVLEDERIRFLGNVEVGGEALPTDRLLELYHAVVYCVGAARDRMLGIPGEELTGVHSATAFVSWYSGHPDAAAEAFDLPGVDAAVVVGAGNVAVDVTRILARGTAELAPTDMPQPALGALAESGVRAVSTVARRGPSQAKFTTKELRELGTLPGVDVRTDPAELALDPVYADPVAAAALPAVARRNLEVLRGWAQAEPAGLPRSIALRFYLRPVEILGGPDGRVTGMRFERTAPDGRGGVIGTGVHEDVAAQLVLRSVGYKGVPLAGLPFDPAKGTVPHAAGRVLRAGRASVGEYVAGWIKRGPTGVIGTNRPCAKETVSALLQDAGALVRRDLPGDPLDALRAAGLRPVRWPGWLAIEAAEADLGRSLGRRSVKIPDWQGLLDAAGPG
ncbi:FAD-dependent oxidoreductase [Streptomyces virginiae]|uniref:FAD-dependent oxidoreductase n=1 Tax=Streptomyces virginiae TaxID=1961 RepID=UPI00224E1809|nr:FAD-dependent oxidoreductase [Streptomyces virginiae]MCX4721264.1 FAD-dependent oxidoreductase [Streptomyces virginiae]MCX5275776.1 FAD-dependent oxidoreductase [Streptomyces virginiae]WSC76056.1 FAD-dependent oxidoreductase [Streptomyces virginiae]